MTPPPTNLDDAALRNMLIGAGLRPTSHRMALARLLFGGPHRHATAADLHVEAADAGHRVSVATVYNTLGQLVAAGLLREVQVDNDRTYFDTNTARHCHIFDVDEGTLTDAPLPRMTPPELDGAEIVDVDVIFRVRRA